MPTTSSRFFVAAAMCAAFLLPASGLHAANAYWYGINPNTDWFTSANWSTNAVPGPLDNVCVQNGRVILDGAKGGAVAEDVRPGTTANQSGTLTMTGSASLTVGNNFAIGASGTGTLIMDGDATLTSAWGILGNLGGTGWRR